MKADDFEKRLQRQPIRQVPADWRDQMLAAAREAASAQPVPCPTARAHGLSGLLSTINHQLSALLWPRPAAWAGLAAVWLVILGLDLATRDAPQGVARRGSRPSPQVFMAFQEQQRLLTELIGPREAPVAEPPKQAPLRPRSERRRDLQMA